MFIIVLAIPAFVGFVWSGFRDLEDLRQTRRVALELLAVGVLIVIAIKSFELEFSHWIYVLLFLGFLYGCIQIAINCTFLIRKVEPSARFVGTTACVLLFYAGGSALYLDNVWSTIEQEWPHRVTTTIQIRDPGAVGSIWVTAKVYQQPIPLIPILRVVGRMETTYDASEENSYFELRPNSTHMDLRLHLDSTEIATFVVP